MDVLRHPRSLARALVLLFAGLLLAGCGGGVKGKGYLFTRDSQALRLNDEATLHQGHKELEFSPTPSLFGTLRLKDERDDVSIDVPRSAYGKRSFFIDGREAGLNYDIMFAGARSANCRPSAIARSPAPRRAIAPAP